MTRRLARAGPAAANLAAISWRRPKRPGQLIRQLIDIWTLSALGVEGPGAN